MLTWGRWDAGFSASTAVHWIADQSDSAPVVLPIKGSMDYQLSGGTQPTDSLGNTGTLNSGSLTADFTNQTVTNELSISIDGSTWNATGSGSITDSGLLLKPSHTYSGRRFTIHETKVRKSKSITGSIVTTLRGKSSALNWR